MSRLIDADSLCEKIAEWQTSANYNEVAKVIRTIVDAPTIDAVEVVRCRDCKRWDETYSFRWAENGKHIYWGKCGLWNHQTESNAYCSYGERGE